MAPPDSEQRKAAKAAWRQQNTERIAAYNAAYRARNRDRARELNRESARRTSDRKKADREKRRAGVVRATKYATEHPEQVAVTKRTWAAANPDKVKKAQREYLQRNRDAVQRTRDVWLLANPDKVAAYSTRQAPRTVNSADSSRQRRADPEKYAHDLDVNRDRRRLARRLEAQGLPPPRTQKDPAVQRRANGVAARAFFARTRSTLEKRDLIRREDPPPSARELQDAARARSEVRRHAEMQQRITKYLERHGERIRREITLDSRARQLRGAEPLNVDAELLRRVRTFADSYTAPARGRVISDTTGAVRARSGAANVVQRRDRGGLSH